MTEVQQKPKDIPQASDFLQEVDRGIEGYYTGLVSGMPRLSKAINNIQKGTYYVLGAQQKTGKTAFLDHFFILQPYLLNPNAKVKWIYFSYEIDRINKMAKWVAYLMYVKHGIRCDLNYILSKGDNQLSPEHRKLVEEIYNNEIVDLFGKYDKYGKKISEGKIDFFDEKENPTGIRNYILNYAKKNGEIIYEDYETEVDGKIVVKQKIAGYIEDDPEQMTIIIIDHMGLLRKERGFNDKQNIDKMSQYLVELRNKFRFSSIAVSQFNRDLGKTERLKFSGEQLQPTMEDFKNTGNMGEDASMVMALFNATRYPHITEHLDYNVPHIGKGYRTIHILSSRNTESDMYIAGELEGKTGYFAELPPAEEIYYDTNYLVKDVNEFRSKIT